VIYLFIGFIKGDTVIKIHSLFKLVLGAIATTGIILFFLSIFCSSIRSAEKEILLTEDNVLILSQGFDSSSVGKLISEARKKDSDTASSYPLYLYLYTPGGSIEDGLTLIEFLKGLNRPVHTVTRFAASMGFQTVQQLGKRYIMKYGTLMSHKARGGFKGEFGDKASQIDSRYGLWLRKVEEMDRLVVARTNGKQTLSSYRAAYSNELWLNGWEAVEQGYADEVVMVKCDSSLKGSRYDKINYMGMEFILEFDRCPINQATLSIKVSIYTNKGKIELTDFVNSGGVFNDECKEGQTCAINKEVNMVIIENKKQELHRLYTKNLRNNVEYSY
jgi:ATP-dependent Clp protease protease subunit